MNKSLKKNIKMYLKEIKRVLPSSSCTKTNFYSVFKNRIYEYAEDNPSATYDDIIKEFGSPEELINSFDSKEYETTLISKKKQSVLLKILTVCLAVVLLLSCIFLYHSLEDVTIYVHDDFEQTN